MNAENSSKPIAPRNHWYMAARRAEIADKPLARVILGEPVVLYRDPTGAMVALEDRCVHRGVPLSIGQVTPEGNLQCMYHGMQYAPTGKCVFVPEQTRVPDKACVRSYPIVERYEWVWIWMGSPEDANPSLIPLYPWFEKPGWGARTAYLYVKCNYKMVVENLLNMAHLPYMHPHTIGSEGVVKAANTTVKRDGKQVLLERKMLDIEPPPTYQAVGQFEGNVNRWQYILYTAPCCLEFNTGVVEATHSVPAVDDTNPSLPGVKILSRHSAHCVVPETDGTSHYFVGFCYDPAGMSEETADFIFESVIKTFKEDIFVLEAQQKHLTDFPNRPTIDIVSDSAGIQAMRVLRELEQREMAEEPIAKAAS